MCQESDPAFQGLERLISAGGVSQVVPYRWRLSGSFVAHLWKAATQQHHRTPGQILARFIPNGAVVFDVGAHAGQYTKLFARLVGDGQVYAFEPGSYARSILRTVIWLRGLDNVAVVPAALGVRAGVDRLTVPLKRRRSFGFGLSHLGAADGRWAAVAQEIVAVTAIDEIVKASALSRLDLIKADIEGWELQMLQGADAAIRRFQPILLLELGADYLARAGDSLDDAFEFLAARDYQCFARSEAGQFVPIAAPSDGELWFFPAGRVPDFERHSR